MAYTTTDWEHLEHPVAHWKTWASRSSASTGCSCRRFLCFWTPPAYCPGGCLGTYDSTIITLVPPMQTGKSGNLFLLKIYHHLFCLFHIQLQVVLPHYLSKWSTRSLYSSLCPLSTQLTMAVSSEHFCRWNGFVQYLKTHCRTLVIDTVLKPALLYVRNKTMGLNPVTAVYKNKN